MSLYMRARYADSDNRERARVEVIPLNVENIKTSGTPHSLKFRCPNNVIQEAYNVLEKYNPLIIEPVREMAFISTNTISVLAMIEDNDDTTRLIDDLISLDVPQRNINVIGGNFTGNTVVLVEAPLDRVNEVLKNLRRYNPIHVFSPEAPVEN